MLLNRGHKKKSDGEPKEKRLQLSAEREHDLPRGASKPERGFFRKKRRSDFNIAKKKRSGISVSRALSCMEKVVISRLKKNPNGKGGKKKGGGGNFSANLFILLAEEGGGFLPMKEKRRPPKNANPSTTIQKGHLPYMKEGGDKRKLLFGCFIPGVLPTQDAGETSNSSHSSEDIVKILEGERKDFFRKGKDAGGRGKIVY